MANEQNLKPFKKGESGNPNGRPKKLPALDELLSEIMSEEAGQTGMTAAKAILLRLRAMAMKGDIRAIQLMLDRSYGKAKETIDLTTGGEPITGITYNVRRSKP